MIQNKYDTYIRYSWITYSENILKNINFDNYQKYVNKSCSGYILHTYVYPKLIDTESRFWFIIGSYTLLYSKCLGYKCLYAY